MALNSERLVKTESVKLSRNERLTILYLDNTSIIKWGLGESEFQLSPFSFT